jgi:hypothetical protein
VEEEANISIVRREMSEQEKDRVLDLLADLLVKMYLSDQAGAPTAAPKQESSLLDPEEYRAKKPWNQLDKAGA